MPVELPQPAQKEIYVGRQVAGNLTTCDERLRSGNGRLALLFLGKRFKGAADRATANAKFVGDLIPREATRAEAGNLEGI